MAAIDKLIDAQSKMDIPTALTMQGQKFDSFSQNVDKLIKSMSALKVDKQQEVLNKLSSQLSEYQTTLNDALKQVAHNHQLAEAKSSVEETLTQKTTEYEEVLKQMREDHAALISQKEQAHAEALKQTQDSHDEAIRQTQDNHIQALRQKQQDLDTMKAERNTLELSLKRRTISLFRTCVTAVTKITALRTRVRSAEKAFNNKESDMLTQSQTFVQEKASLTKEKEEAEGLRKEADRARETLEAEMKSQNTAYEQEKEQLRRAFSTAGDRCKTLEELRADAVQKLAQANVAAKEAQTTFDEQMSSLRRAGENVKSLHEASERARAKAEGESATLVKQLQDAVASKETISSELADTQLSLRFASQAVDNADAAIQERTETLQQHLTAESGRLNDHYRTKYERKVAGIDCPKCPALRTRLEQAQTQLDALRKELAEESSRDVQIEAQCKAFYRERVESLEQEHILRREELERDHARRQAEFDTQEAELDAQEAVQERRYHMSMQGLWDAHNARQTDLAKEQYRFTEAQQKDRDLLVQRSVTAEMQVKHLEEGQFVKLEDLGKTIDHANNKFNNVVQQQENNQARIITRLDVLTKLVEDLRRPQPSKSVNVNEISPATDPSGNQFPVSGSQSSSERNALQGNDRAEPLSPRVSQVDPASQGAADGVLGKRVNFPSESEEPTHQAKRSRQCHQPADDAEPALSDGLQVNVPSQQVEPLDKQVVDLLDSFIRAAEGNGGSADEAEKGDSSGPNLGRNPDSAGIGANPNAPSVKRRSDDDSSGGDSEAKASRMIAMFFLEDLTPEEETEFKSILRRGLGKSEEKFQEQVDKYCLGHFDDPEGVKNVEPRRCFLAALCGGAPGSTNFGPKSARSTCPRCKKDHTHACYYVQVIAGLATGFGERLPSGSIASGEARKWDPKRGPRTTFINSVEVRWVARKRKPTTKC